MFLLHLYGVWKRKDAAYYLACIKNVNEGSITEVADFEIRGRIINKVRFADDIAKTQEELHWGMGINKSQVTRAIQEKK